MHALRVSVLLLLLPLLSQAQVNIPADLQKTRAEVARYIYKRDYDSAQSMVNNMQKAHEKDSLYLFYSGILTAEILKATDQQTQAIQVLRRTTFVVPADNRPELFLSLLYGSISESYFNFLQYDSAAYYAGRSVETSPDTSLRAGGHAVNYVILGYNNYRNKEYASALKYYNSALEENRRNGEQCEMPLCYNKIALIYNATGRTDDALAMIDRSLRISDSCGIEQYTLLSKRTMFDIYFQNKQHEKALSTLMEINTLVEQIGNKSHARQLDELRMQFETQLLEKENSMLRDLNNKNEEVLMRQKQALISAVALLVISTLLIFLLVRVSGKRKAAEAEARKANISLEEKVAVRTMNLEEANNKIRENSELLGFQNKQLVDFCNIISHNLRGPLGNMSVLISLAEASKTPEDKNAVLDKLRPVVANLNATFDELVESLQIRQDKEIKSVHNSFQDCTRRVLTDLEADIIRTEAKVHTDFTEAPEVYYPHKYLISILHNLISNAMKYRSHERKPEIFVTTKRSGESIVLSVKDNGLGIDLSRHSNDLFKIRKIFHEHPDAKGFGLFITKTQVEAMNGKIWAESTPGNGSSFHVVFTAQNTNGH